VDLRLLRVFLQFLPVPKCYPPIINSPLLNICPNTLPPSTSWSSCCSYTLSLNVENFLDKFGNYRQKFIRRRN